MSKRPRTEAEKVRRTLFWLGVAIAANLILSILWGTSNKAIEEKTHRHQDTILWCAVVTPTGDHA